MECERLDMRRNDRMERIEKPWGYEEYVETNDRYVVKRLFMRKGNQCSLQYHEKKRETVVVLEGRLTVLLDGKARRMTPFEAVTIPPGLRHRMIAEEGDCLYMEASTPEVDDVVRLEDSYGRVDR